MHFNLNSIGRFQRMFKCCEREQLVLAHTSDSRIVMNANCFVDRVISVNESCETIEKNDLFQM